MLKRKQVKLIEVTVSDLSRVRYMGETGINTPNAVYFSVNGIKAKGVGSQSQSYFLDKMTEIEDTVIVPVLLADRKIASDMLMEKYVSGSHAVVVATKKANGRKRVARKTMETLMRYRKYRATIKAKRPLHSVVSFKFGGQDTSDMSPKTRDMVLDVLHYGATCVETGQTYYRTFRTPSHLRGGGAWLSIFPEKLREVFSFGFEKDMQTPFETVASKWESQLTLSLTNALPTNVGKNMNICVVEDLVREVTVDATMVEKGVNTTRYEMFDSKVEGEPGLHVENLNPADEEDFKFHISTGRTTRKIELTDGYCVTTPEIMERIKQSVRLFDTKKGEYFHAIQFRMPLMKGMMVEFDYKAYCAEQGITHIRDIYGKLWDVTEIDMVVPESVFKGADRFNSIDEYVSNVLDGTFEFEGHTFNYFNNFDYLRVVNHNKEKDEFNKMTYQYLQSLMGLDTTSGVAFTQQIFGHATNCTTDINSARALTGMLGASQEDFNESLVSKVQYILDLKPSLFETNFVKRRLLNMVENLVLDQCRGRVMVKGAYHFIISDPTLIFHGAVDGILEGKDRDVLASDEKAGIIEKGKHYLKGKVDGDVVAGFRSPLVDKSESAIIEFTDNAELEKWLGHLKGIIVLNGYEPTAMRMGGADYDGDKIFITDNAVIINAVPRDENGNLLPLVISPMEGVSGGKCRISKDELWALDQRTLNNLTGIYTNMGTFYQNKLVHIHWAFKRYINNQADASVEGCFAEYKKLFPESHVKFEHFTKESALATVISEYKGLVEELEYNLVVIRFAQASEIDFPKHGIRMPFPKRVTTKEKIDWLGTAMIDPSAKKVAKEYNSKAWVWEVISERTGKPYEKKIYCFNSPMQAICDYTKDTWRNLKKSNLTTTGNDFLSALLDTRNVSIPGSVHAIIDEVRSIRTRYCKEMSQFALNREHMDDDQQRDELKGINTRYTEECLKFTNRKALAISAVYISQQEMDSDDNFAFVVAFDGIVEMLTEQQDVVVRNVRVDVPYETDCIEVRGDVAYFIEPASGSELTVELPEALADLADGIYPIVNTMNARFMTFSKQLSAQEKQSIIKYAYNQQHQSKAHAVNIRKSVDYSMNLVGFKFNNLTSESAVKLIMENNGIAKVVEEVVKGISRPSIEVAGRIIGTIKRLDSIAIKDNGTVNFAGMYGKMIKLDVSDAVVYTQVENGTDTKPVYANSLTVKANVVSEQAFEYELEDWQAHANLNQWYFQREWLPFSHYGYVEHNVTIIDGKPVVGQLVGTVDMVDADGMTTHVRVGLSKTENGNVLRLGKITRGETVISADNATKDLTATIFRAISFAFAKRDFVPVQAVIPGADEFYASVKARREERQSYASFWKSAMANQDYKEYLEFKAELKAKAIAEKKAEQEKAKEEQAIAEQNRVDQIMFWKSLVKKAREQRMYETITSVVNGKVEVKNVVDIHAYMALVIK